MEKIKAFGAVPSYRQMEWYKREKSAFFHFGMNTFTNNEWGDGTDLPSTFNLKELDCEQWIRAIKEAGFTTAIITAKHHDGFCLWPSRYTDYSVKNSPYKNGDGDIVREFTDACHKYEIKVGIYLSPWDRHEKCYGSDEYNDYYSNQLTELMTDYGKIYECWWDGAGSTEANYDWARWAYIVRNLQRDCVIFGSLGATDFVESRWIGNESGSSSENCWATINPEALIKETVQDLNNGCFGGERFIPAEADTSIRPGWFYHSEQDNMVKTPSELFQYWFDSVGSNAGMLLNIPPNRDGRIMESDIRSIIQANQLEKRTFLINLAHGASIKADSTVGDYCVQKILCDDELFYMSESQNCQISITLSAETKFDCISISEKIEFGHRINDFSVEALVNDEWKLLVKGKCIGYKKAIYFDEVLSKNIRLTIKGADIPIIRHFGIYKLPDNCFELIRKINNKTDLSKGPSAKINVTKTEIEVEFGGVFTFNTIKFNGTGVRKYNIEKFNGTQYETIYTGFNPENEQIDSLEDEKGSYKIRIVATEGEFLIPEIGVLEV